MHKLIDQQLNVVALPYVVYHGREVHHHDIPINPQFKYYCEDGVRRGEYYMCWDLTFAGEVHKFQVHVLSHECYRVNVEFASEPTHMVAAQEIIARFIAEVAGKIEAWAVANNVPPGNMMY